jgi:hypothetical protein
MKTTNTKTTNAKAKVTKPVAKTEQKPEVKVEPKVSYFKEIVLTLSNKKSLLSSKKIERAIVFITFLTLTIIYLINNIEKLESLELVEITGLWLAYGGYNSAMNYRDRKLEKTTTPEEEVN